MNDAQENKILHALLDKDPKKVIDVVEDILNDTLKKVRENHDKDLEEVRRLLKGQNGEKEALEFIKDLIGE